MKQFRKTPKACGKAEIGKYFGKCWTTYQNCCVADRGTRMNSDIFPILRSPQHSNSTITQSQSFPSSSNQNSLYLKMFSNYFVYRPQPLQPDCQNSNVPGIYFTGYL